MSSSSEETESRTWRRADRPDLRRGVWTRLGHPSALGDDVTEQALGRLAERTRSAARAQGYAVGWAEGRAEALARAAEAAAIAEREASARERERDAEHQLVLDALTRAATGLHEAMGAACERVSDQASTLALEVTRELVDYELTVATDPGAGVVRRVLSALPPEPFATVRMHPAAAESTAAADLAARGIVVRADDSLEPDDAVVEVEHTAIDLRIGTALERLQAVLQ